MDCDPIKGCRVEILHEGVWGTLTQPQGSSGGGLGELACSMFGLRARPDDCGGGPPHDPAVCARRSIHVLYICIAHRMWAMALLTMAQCADCKCIHLLIYLSMYMNASIRLAAFLPAAIY